MPAISRFWRIVTTAAPVRPGRRVALLLSVGVALVVWSGSNAFGSPSVSSTESTSLHAASGGMAASSRSPEVGALLARAHLLQRRWTRVEGYYELHVAPLRRVLLDYNNDPALARKVAVALVREANRAGVEPRVLLAVLLVENPSLNPNARSSVGAVGLMQVMPLHRGHWRKCRGALDDIDTNICYGAQIFASLYEQTGDPELALLRYNGCVRGTNTPDCRQYPSYVYARAGRASLLAWLSPRPAGAASP